MRVHMWKQETPREETFSLKSRKRKLEKWERKALCQNQSLSPQSHLLAFLPPKHQGPLNITLFCEQQWVNEQQLSFHTPNPATWQALPTGLEKQSRRWAVRKGSKRSLRCHSLSHSSALRIYLGMGLVQIPLVQKSIFQKVGSGYIKHFHVLIYISRLPFWSALLWTYKAMEKGLEMQVRQTPLALLHSQQG